ncbi:hypothetical protein SUGI_1112810 [Cryptomeria japonica]|nr:hypothetical protein SUGI_1112810 [Cryptomeria japonica]
MAKVIHTISDSSSQGASGSSEEAVHGDVERNFTINGPNIVKKDEEEEEIEQTPNHPPKTSHNKVMKVESPASMVFPMARVKRLIKSEEDIRSTVEAAFLVNKATVLS